MTASDENNLRIFERKILRKIFGSVKGQNNDYRIRFNQDLLNLMEGEDVIKFIKAQRIRWAEHLERIDRERALRRVYEAVCMTTIDAEEGQNHVGGTRWKMI